MERKITIRLSDEEYDIVQKVAGWHKNNKSLAIREIIKYYKEMAILSIPTRKFLEEYNKLKDDLPFT